MTSSASGSKIKKRKLMLKVEFQEFVG